MLGPIREVQRGLLVSERLEYKLVVAFVGSVADGLPQLLQGTSPRMPDIWLRLPGSGVPRNKT